MRLFSLLRKKISGALSNDAYQRQLRRRWASAPTTGMPEPWRHVPLPHLGGLFAVGFDPEGRYLLTLSGTGRGVIDCHDGKKIARDPNEDEHAWLDRPRLLAKGIGPLAGEEIRVVGSFIGGGLTTITHDGWIMQAATPNWPNAVVWCEKPGSKGFYLDGDFYKLWDWDAPFAYGFSEPGNIALIACSNSVEMWAR